MEPTQIIVLRKQPYQERGLLFSGISPDFGKLTLIAGNARKISEKDFPVIDLFRELQLEFEPSANSEIHKATSCELLTSFDALAEKARNFRFVGRVASFVLKNTPPDLPAPLGYDVFRNLLLQQLLPEETDGRWTMEQAAVAFKTVFLYENGLLPESGTEREGLFLENLIASGIDGASMPDAPPGYWRQLNLWLDSLLEYHKLAK